MWQYLHVYTSCKNGRLNAYFSKDRIYKNVYHRYLLLKANVYWITYARNNGDSISKGQCHKSGPATNSKVVRD